MDIKFNMADGVMGECSIKGYTAAEIYVRQHAFVLRILQ